MEIVFFFFVKFQKGTTVRLGRANGNVGRRSAWLRLWLRGREQETRTLLSQMESKMDAERCCSLGKPLNAGAADDLRLQEEAQHPFTGYCALRCSSSLLLTGTSESQMFPNAPKPAKSESGSHLPFSDSHQQAHCRHGDSSHAHSAFLSQQGLHLSEARWTRSQPGKRQRNPRMEPARMEMFVSRART